MADGLGDETMQVAGGRDRVDAETHAQPLIRADAEGGTAALEVPTVSTLVSPRGERLRVGEVVEQDMTIENGKVTSYRVKLNVSFKYEPDGAPARRSTAKKRSR